MIDYKQANPDHTLDQFNKALKELDPEIRKVCLPFFKLFTQLTLPFNSRRLMMLEAKNSKQPKPDPPPARPVRLLNKFVKFPLPRGVDW